MYDVTKLLPNPQLVRLLRLLPTPYQHQRGRKRCRKSSLVKGVLQVLVLGIPWYKMAACGCSFMSCYRYFKELQRRGYLRKIFQLLSLKKTNLCECAADTNTARSYRFPYQVGWDGRHKVNGTKISLLTDKEGLPADVIVATAKRHDSSFLDDHLKNTGRRRKKTLNLDKIYVSVDRRRLYRKRGIKINMQTRDGDYIRKRGPKFTFDPDKYRVRFKVERTFAWMENCKRVKYRLDRYISSYRAFVYLSLIIILLRN